jgi:Uma2 family endonuclease
MAREVEDKNIVPASVNASPYPKMTFEQFVDWEPDDERHEWVDGEVIDMTAPSRDHESIQGFLAALFRFYAEHNESGKVFGPGYLMHLPKRPSGRRPDVQFTSKERRELMLYKYLEGGSDLAVEIISPGGRTRDRRDKFHEYEQAGIREYWLIDPIRKQADFYLLDDTGKYSLADVGPDNVFYSRVLDGLYVRVEWFWMDPMPTLLSILREWKIV